MYVLYFLNGEIVDVTEMVGEYSDDKLDQTFGNDCWKKIDKATYDKYANFDRANTRLLIDSEGNITETENLDVSSEETRAMQELQLAQTQVKLDSIEKALSLMLLNQQKERLQQ